MYIILSLFVVDYLFLDWKPWDRGGRVTSSGRGANHRICDTRWTESATCDIVWSRPTPFERWLSCHNLVALNHCKQRLTFRTVLLFQEFISDWYIAKWYKEFELLPFPSIFKIIPFFWLNSSVALARVLCIKYVSAYHKLFKIKKSAHVLGTSCYLVSNFGDFIVCNTWICQIHFMNLNSSPYFYVAMSGQLWCACCIVCQGQKRKWSLNTYDSELRWNHEMDCFGCEQFRVDHLRNFDLNLCGLSVTQSFEVKVMIGETKNLMSVLDHLFVNSTAGQVKRNWDVTLDRVRMEVSGKVFAEKSC